MVLYQRFAEICPENQIFPVLLEDLDCISLNDTS